MTTRKMRLASSIQGRQVRNPDGDDLGTIDDLLLDTGLGSPAFAVISYGGFLGLGEQSYAVPFEALTSIDDGFLLSIDSDRMKAAPVFQLDSHSDFDDENTLNTVRDHYLRS